MKPTIGRIVHYTLSKLDADAINATRQESPAHVGNHAHEGMVCPAMIVRTWGENPEAAVNLQVHTDGNHTHWVTSRAHGDGPGQWAWPARDAS